MAPSYNLANELEYIRRTIDTEEKLEQYIEVTSKRDPEKTNFNLKVVLAFARSRLKEIKCSIP